MACERAHTHAHTHTGTRRRTRALLRTTHIRRCLGLLRRVLTQFRLQARQHPSHSPNTRQAGGCYAGVADDTGYAGMSGDTGASAQAVDVGVGPFSRQPRLLVRSPEMWDGRNQQVAWMSGGEQRRQAQCCARRLRRLLLQVDGVICDCMRACVLSLFPSLSLSLSLLLSLSFSLSPLSLLSPSLPPSIPLSLSLLPLPHSLPISHTSTCTHMTHMQCFGDWADFVYTQVLLLQQQADSAATKLEVFNIGIS